MKSMETHHVGSMTCYICLENIVTMNKKFGLQNNCDHVFCFDCLLTWRRTNRNGRCPLCRIRSTFIASSERCFDNTDDKQYLIDRHKLSLKTILCRTLSEYGYCRFGHRCYYNHNISVSFTISNNHYEQQQQPPRRITYNSYRYRP